MIQIIPYILGPLENNTFLVLDVEHRQSIVIDPSFDCEQIIHRVAEEQLAISHILITHAHFDHVAGVNLCLSSLSPNPIVALHALDLPLWNGRGDAPKFGVNIDPLPPPDHLLKDQDIIQIGNTEIKVIHTPGHTPGHVVFSISESHAVLCGDLIFACGIGRTDLPGGDHALLMKSIDEKIMVLADKTELFPGHGPKTSVGEERKYNPHLK